MEVNNSPNNNTVLLMVVGAAAWIVPGGGYFVLGDRRRSLIVLVTVLLTFLAGLYIGSIGVIDPIGSKPWYVAQMMNSPAVMLIGNHVARTQIAAHQAVITARTPSARQAADEYSRDSVYRVFGKSMEIGQIYTSIAGLLNLLCIVNAMYLAHLKGGVPPGDSKI